MATIASLMQTNLIIAAPSEPVANAATRMRENGVGAVLVVEGGELAGIFSERDLVCRVVAEGADPRVVTVGQVATTPVVTVTSDTHVTQCVELFRREGFRHLPVVDHGKPVGLIGLRDLLLHVADVLERIVDSDAYRQAVAQGTDPYDRFGGGYAH